MPWNCPSRVRLTLSFTMNHDYSAVQNSGALYPLCTLSYHNISIRTGCSLAPSWKCRFYFMIEFNMIHVKSISKTYNDRSSSTALDRRTRGKYCFTVTDLFKEKLMVGVRWSTFRKHFYGAREEKNEVYKPKGRTGNDNEGRVSYQSSWVTDTVILLHISGHIWKIYF